MLSCHVDILYRDILWWIYSTGISCGGYTLQGYIVVDILYWDILCWVYSTGISCVGYTLQGYLVVDILYRDILWWMDILYRDILWWMDILYWDNFDLVTANFYRIESDSIFSEDGFN